MSTLILTTRTMGLKSPPERRSQQATHPPRISCNADVEPEPELEPEPKHIADGNENEPVHRSPTELIPPPRRSRFSTTYSNLRTRYTRMSDTWTVWSTYTKFLSSIPFSRQQDDGSTSSFSFTSGQEIAFSISVTQKPTIYIYLNKVSEQYVRKMMITDKIDSPSWIIPLPLPPVFYSEETKTYPSHTNTSPYPRSQLQLQLLPKTISSK